MRHRGAGAGWIVGAAAAVVGVGLAGAVWAQVEPMQEAEAVAVEPPAPDEGGAPADGAAADEPGAGEGEAIELTVVPAGIHISQSINFDQNGEIQNQNEHCSISLRCSYPADFSPLTYRFADVRVVTEAGDQIVPQVNSNESNINRRGRNGNARPEFSISFSLPAVPAADSLRRIEGNVVLKVGQAPQRKAVLGPYGELRGKRIKIAEYPETRITVTEENDRVRITYQGDDWKLIDDVAFINGDGGTLPFDQWGGGGSDKQWHQDYRVDLPDDGQIVLTFWTGTREVTAPFRLENVPMPRGRMDEGAFDLVFNARPPGEVRIPGVGADLRGDLEVIVE